jgi:hypothetical protein
MCLEIKLHEETDENLGEASTVDIIRFTLVQLPPESLDFVLKYLWSTK